ncbi:MAG TPA: hypothetical protein VLY87_05775 [Flavobacterium sp.]|nr:hypothetical protein [Flavobacterium sp.]
MLKVIITYKGLSSLLNQAFFNNIFPSPKKGELLVGLDINKQIHIKEMNLYFKKEFHKEVLSRINQLEYSQEVINSNAANDWKKLFSELKETLFIENIEEDTSPHIATQP